MRIKRFYALDWWLMLLDFLLVIAAFFAAYTIRLWILAPVLLPQGLMDKVYLTKDIPALVLYPALLVASLVINSFYNVHFMRKGMNAVRAIAVSTLIAGVALTSIIYLFSHQKLVSRLQIGLMALIAGMLLLCRWMLFRVHAQRQRDKSNPQDRLQSITVPFPIAAPVDLALMVAAYFIAHLLRMHLLEPALVPRGWMLHAHPGQYFPLLPLYPVFMLIVLGLLGFYAFAPRQRFSYALLKIMAAAVGGALIVMAVIYMFAHHFLVTRWQIVLMGSIMAALVALRWLALRSVLNSLHSASESRAARPDRPFPQVRIGEIDFDSCTMREAVEWLAARAEAHIPTFVITPNLDHLYRYSQFPRMREAGQHADLVLADGVPIYWLSQFAGRALPEKVSGSDLFQELCAAAAQRGLKVYLLGGAPGVGEKAAANLMERFPGLIVAGTDAPPLHFERDPALLGQTLGRLREAQPDMLFVALGTERQQRFMVDHADAMGGVALRVEVGASIDFVAGMQKRAPRIVQQVGLEWFWRLALNPRRLFRRYILEDLPYLLRLMAQMLRESKR